MISYFIKHHAQRGADAGTSASDDAGTGASDDAGTGTPELFRRKYVNDVGLANMCPALSPYYNISLYFAEDLLAVAGP